MGGKKKKKAGRKKKAETPKHISADEFADRGAVSLKAGNFRDAIKYLKSALNKGYDEDALKPEIFRAYVGRKNQLSEKNMSSEAEAIKEVGRKFMPLALQMNEDILLSCVDFLSLKEWIGVYNDYMSHHGISGKAEKKIAHLVFVEGLWDTLSCLDDQSPLARDARVVRDSVAHMESGSWDMALEIIKKTPRSSPCFGIHAFAKAMDSFVKNDDKSLKRSLSGIPDDFPLKSAVLSLAKSVSDEKEGFEDAEKSDHIFWDIPPGMSENLRSIIKKASSGRLKGLAEDIKELSQAIYPQKPDEAAMTIMGILGSRMRDRPNDILYLEKLSRSIFPKEKARLANHWLHMFSCHHVFSSAVSYIKGLERIFFRESEIRAAHSMILLRLSTRVKIESYMLDVEMDTDFEDPDDLLGIEDLGFLDDDDDDELYYDEEIYEDDEAYLLMLLKALSIDPENREAWEELAGLKLDRDDRKKVIPVLEKISRKSVEDPFVCLELAKLYDANNAFRKAEKILEEALSRAPHSVRVQEKCALAHLVAADKNIKRKKYFLAMTDIEAAEKYNIPVLRDAVVCKKMVLEIKAGEKDMFEAMKGELSVKNPVQRLKRLFLVWEDFERMNDAAFKEIKGKLEHIIKTGIREKSSLPSREAVELFAARPDGYDSLYPLRHMRIEKILFQSRKFMFFLNDDDFLMVMDSLLKRGLLRAPLFSHIEERILRKGEKQFVLMFYLEAMRAIDGNLFSYPKKIERLIKSADTKTLDALKRVSKKMAEHMPHFLQADFRDFNFRETSGLFSFLPDMSPGP